MWSNREKDKELVNWISEFSVDFERIFEAVKIILDLYKLVKSYDENKQMEDLLKRLPRPQLQSTSSSSTEVLNQQMHLKIEQKF